MKTNCFYCGRRCSVALMLENKGKCPYFCRKISVEIVAKMVNKCSRTVERWSAEKVEAVAREHGYKVIVYDFGKRRKYYGGKIKNAIT